MTTKIKTVLMAVFFLFGLLSAIQAQEKYDFAVVSVSSNKIRVLQNDQTEILIDTGKKPTDVYGNMERLLSQVSKMTEQGWELITVSNGWDYFLKQKKK